MQGYLMKKARSGAWQPRYFATRGPFLSYKQKKSAETEWTIGVDLREAKIDLIQGEIFDVIAVLGFDSARETRTIELRSSTDAHTSINNPDIVTWHAALLKNQRGRWNLSVTAGSPLDKRTEAAAARARLQQVAASESARRETVTLEIEKIVTAGKDNVMKFGFGAAFMKLRASGGPTLAEQAEEAAARARLQEDEARLSALQGDDDAGTTSETFAGAYAAVVAENVHCESTPARALTALADLKNFHVASVECSNAQLGQLQAALAESVLHEREALADIATLLQRIKVLDAGSPRRPTQPQPHDAPDAPPILLQPTSLVFLAEQQQGRSERIAALLVALEEQAATSEEEGERVNALSERIEVLLHCFFSTLLIERAQEFDLEMWTATNTREACIKAMDLKRMNILGAVAQRLRRARVAAEFEAAKERT